MVNKDQPNNNDSSEEGVDDYCNSRFLARLSLFRVQLPVVWYNRLRVP